MKTVTMMLIEETGAKVIKQNPAMEEMAARIGAVGRMDIIPMRPNFDQIYLAFDMAKNPDGPMYDGWEGERKLMALRWHTISCRSMKYEPEKICSHLVSTG